MGLSRQFVKYIQKQIKDTVRIVANTQRIRDKRRKYEDDTGKSSAPIVFKWKQISLRENSYLFPTLIELIKKRVRKPGKNPAILAAADELLFRMLFSLEKPKPKKKDEDKKKKDSRHPTAGGDTPGESVDTDFTLAGPMSSGVTPGVRYLPNKGNMFGVPFSGGARKSGAPRGGISSGGSSSAGSYGGGGRDAGSFDGGTIAALLGSNDALGLGEAADNGAVAGPAGNTTSEGTSSPISTNNDAVLGDSNTPATDNIVGAQDAEGGSDAPASEAVASVEGTEDVASTPEVSAEGNDSASESSVEGATEAKVSSDTAEAIGDAGAVSEALTDSDSVESDGNFAPAPEGFEGAESFGDTDPSASFGPIDAPVAGTEGQALGDGDAGVAAVGASIDAMSADNSSSSSAGGESSSSAGAASGGDSGGSAGGASGGSSSSAGGGGSGGGSAGGGGGGG